MATQAEVRELIAHIRRTGYKVAKSGSKHYKVLTPGGAVVTDSNGPLIISSSPSDNRFREMTVKRLMAAKVFKTDPYKETRGDKATGNQAHGGTTSGARKGQGIDKNGKRNALADPEVQAKKVAAIKRISDANRERTGRLRARFEPIVVKLGGWSPGGRQSTHGVKVAEVGETIFAWAKSRGRAELPERLHNDPARFIEASHVAAAVQSLKKPGETLGTKWTPLLEVFIDELERNSGTPPNHERSAHRFRELLREAKGISPGPSTPAAMPPPLKNGQVAEVARPVETTVKLGPGYDPKAPALALRAMWLMAKGGGEDQTEAMDIATGIAELELRRQLEEAK